MTKLLVVDDEKIIRQTISQHIPWSTMDIEVVGTAKNGIEAYDLILDESPDIVITDIKMPGLSGLELLQRVKTINKDVEFIILSGYGEFDFAREAMQWGVRHYLLKPCSEESVIQSVRDVMDEIARRRAFQDIQTDRHPLALLDNTVMLNIINEGVAFGTGEGAPDFAPIYHPYRKFLDFDKESYQLCYLYFVDEAALPESLEMIHDFWESYAPGIVFHALYVHQTLLFFFRSFHYEYKELDDTFARLLLQNQSLSPEYQRVPYSCLSGLLDTVIRKIRRYGTIYYDSDKVLITICNYRSIIREADALTASLYSEDLPAAQKALSALLELLSSIADPVFLKQLTSSVIMLSSSRCLNFSALDATEFLLEVEHLKSCAEVFKNLSSKLEKIFHDYHGAAAGRDAISARIDEYVKRSLSDPNLSLKWIAENYLYMNVDYVSKKFFRETGQKFSNYLTGLRIQKAKELLSESGGDKILSVAEMVGCGNNPPYFSQLFKKATGMTPSGYIKYISGGNQNDE